MELNIYVLIVLAAQIFAAGAVYGHAKKEVRNRWYNILFDICVLCFGVVLYAIAGIFLIFRKLKGK